ncbi:4533_t:CDS:2 [Acaulospora morrowiae]|uniref:4533_t:CDS:1 n=1 Tax=Acaulospora morrowiae TaxID=94023 RepID=A0A9N9BHV6_9GLOM|nr:4533_t:CDS:2 [Acaulospora morrowiae]
MTIGVIQMKTPHKPTIDHKTYYNICGTGEVEKLDNENEIWDKIIYEDEEVDEREGYYTERAFNKTNAQGEQELDLLGPVVYLSQVEEFPIETKEDQEEEETIEDKIREMELDGELEEEQIEQAKGTLIREQDVFA